MALNTLLKTAVVFSSPKQEVKARIVDGATSVTLILEATGKPLEEDTIARFFDLSSSVRNSTSADILSLKPVVAERVISLYGGFVQLRNHDNTGIGINITMKKSLPVESVEAVD